MGALHDRRCSTRWRTAWHLSPESRAVFAAAAMGLGPAVMKGVKIGLGDVTLIAKWVHDIEVENRLRATSPSSFALKLWPKLVRCSLSLRR
jgi:hypothetical protein